MVEHSAQGLVALYLTALH